MLRALAVADRDRLTLDTDGEHWFGYVRRREPAAVQPRQDSGTIVVPLEFRVTKTARRVPLKMPVLPHALVERQPRTRPGHQEKSVGVTGPVEPLDEESARAPSPVRRVGYEDLVPKARLLPALRREVAMARAGPLDLHQLVVQIAARQLPRNLPRRRMQRWHPGLVVVLDFCARLWPYREDMHRLAERLLRRCGRSGLSIRILNHGPEGPWRDWLAEQNVPVLAEPPARRWTALPPGTPVLLVSDLGLLLGARSATAVAWWAFIRDLSKADLKPLALLPLGADQLDGGLPPELTILRWSPDARPRPERPRGTGQPMPAGLDDLLAMAAAACRVDPPLLRALRRINPRAPLNAGIEGALWCHADVEAGTAAAVRREVRDQHLRRFAALVAADQLRVERRRFDHHAHLRAALNHEETLVWSANASVVAGNLPPEVVRRIEEAKRFVDRLAASLKQSGPTTDRATWQAVARDFVLGADARIGDRYAELLTPLVAALMRIEGALPDVPDWVDPAALARLAGDEQDRAECWLVLDPARQGLLLQAAPASGNQISYGWSFPLEGGARLNVGQGNQERRRWLSSRDLPAVLAALDLAEPVVLETARETITLVPVQRPRGALSWSADRTGLRVSSAPFGEAQMHWPADDLRPTRSIDLPDGRVVWKLSTWITTRELGPHARVSFQIDPVYGVQATLHLKAPYGKAAQAFRWIEPGTFTMGSPETEPERLSNEGPAHPVTISRGFWLGDTVCTQALWQAVMGNSPSHFKGDDQRPVEQVSWNDVQGFLRKLEALLPGCQADLPTEAEWEYACRAGTDTPFSFGTNITPEQVNYNGNHPYAGAEKGPYRQQTVPVESLPPNPWGLYEMHGNVSEWCSDGSRYYLASSIIDPLGAVFGRAEARRSFRGGSWRDFGVASRSATRRISHPGSKGLTLGFRLCLRSVESGQALGQLGKLAGVATGGSEPASAPPRGEAVGKESLLERLKKAFRPGRSGRREPDEQA